MTGLLSQDKIQWPCDSRNRGFLQGVLIALIMAAPTVAEERQVYSAGSPGWLQAVGKLQVPGSRVQDGRRSHKREDCSATLVTASTGLRADTIVTAWHCLEYYRDLSKPILFTLPGTAGDAISREVYQVADGGGMHADWAVLKMHRPIAPALVPALTLHPGRADMDQPVTMAGFSRDPGLGNGGTHLTYDELCAITGQGISWSNTDCSAYKGASGGAVVQLSETGASWFCGVISRGNSDGLSIFVPVDSFRGALTRALR